MGNPLEGVELKLARASEHFKVLGDEIDRFLDPPDAEKPYGSVLKKEDKTGKRFLCASVHRGPPRHLSLLIGDLLHNVRSALDQLAWKLGGDPPPNKSSSEFPIFCDRATFHKNPRGRSGVEKIVGVKKAAQAIIEEVQPFNGGGDPELHPLWMLHKLSTEDKHRLPIITGLVVEGGVEAQMTTGGVDIALTDWRGTLNIGAFKVGDPIAEWTVGAFDREPESHEDFNIIFGVAFDPEGPGRGREVRDALSDCIAFVGGTVLPRLAPFA